MFALRGNVTLAHCDLGTAPVGDGRLEPEDPIRIRQTLRQSPQVFAALGSATRKQQRRCGRRYPRDPPLSKPRAPPPAAASARCCIYPLPTLFNPSLLVTGHVMWERSPGQ